MWLGFPGGQVSLKVRNDGPTLVGANTSFSIALHFPGSQKVLPDGQVIWVNNTIINGKHLSQYLLSLTHSWGSDSEVSPVSPGTNPFLSYLTVLGFKPRASLMFVKCYSIDLYPP